MANELILIVDDVPENLTLLGQILRSDYRISVAVNGKRALEIALSDTPPDLILLDVMMPEMDGYELCSLLKANTKTKDIPIIFITAKSAESDETKGFNLGAVDYITKPISLPIVKSRIRTHLELKNQRERLKERTRELNQAFDALDVRNRFIRQIFGRYLSDDIVDTILETPEGLQMGGEKREITLMMTDIRGFTTIAERLPAEDVVGIINTYLEIMTEIILKYQGTINEFIGDAILVLFGAPIAREDHAKRAVACALEMQVSMAEVNRRCREKGYPEVRQGIGINTGSVVVGNIGSSKRTKYGVVGNNVNLTSRIESYSLGGQILISENTRNACGSTLEINRQMVILPKGFHSPVTIFDVRGIGGDFNIFLPQKKASQVVNIERPLEIKFRILTGMQTIKTEHEGKLIELEEMAGEIETRQLLCPLTNIKISLFDEKGSRVTSDLYAKIIENISESPQVYKVHFTSVPVEAETFMQKLLTSPITGN